jgi:hypothetical protein
MKYFHLVNVFDRHNNASYQKFSLLFSELLDPADMVAQIPSRKQIHHKIKIVSVIEGKVHVGNELMSEFFQNLPFI